MSASIKKIAVVGGSGQIGQSILSALVEAKRFDITAISRSDSNAVFAPTITVKQGDYSSKEFFLEALKNQEVLIIALAFTVPDELHSRLISAAAEAGVKFVLLNEYGSDNAHPLMREVPINAVKTQHREHVEKLGRSSWIGIVNNPWYDYVRQFAPAACSLACAIVVDLRFSHYQEASLVLISRTKRLPCTIKGTPDSTLRPAQRLAWQ